MDKPSSGYVAVGDLGTRLYKSNNQTRGGLGRVCATGMYRRFSEISNRSVCQMESATNLPKMDCEVFSLHAHDEYDMILIYITERRIYL